MSDRNSPPLPSPGAADRRRASVTGQAIADLFGRNPQNAPNSGQANGATPAYPGSITSAAAQAQRRRLSLTTVGLSASANQPSFSTFRPRRGSQSSANSGSVDESPFEDTDGPPASANPTTPFARRLSFGVNALRDARSMSNAGTGNSNEGFNFAENMRSRAKRSSISSPSGMPPTPLSAQPRAKSVATLEPPAKEMPKQAKGPDAFQERILKGDFYMD